MTSAATWGWRVLLGVAVLLALNGIALGFVATSPETFEEDTGVSREELQSEYPTVVEELDGRVRTLSILLTSLALVALVAAWAGHRGGSRWAWHAWWVVFATFALLTVRFFVGGRPEIGLFYLFWVAATLVGLVLASKGGRHAPAPKPS